MACLEVKRLRVGQMNMFIAPDRSAREAVADFLKNPMECMQEGVICKPGSRGYAVMAELAGHRCFVKHYRCLGPGYRIFNAFRRSRAVRTWQVSWELLADGIRVPRPLFCVEQRSFRLLGESYLATEFIDDAVNLFSYWKTAGLEERRAVLQQCAAVIGGLHAHGWCHGDLKWRNFMVKSAQGIEVIVVDNDAAHRCHVSRERRVRSDLDRFLRDLELFGSQQQVVAEFMSTWSAALGGSRRAR